MSSHDSHDPHAGEQAFRNRGLDIGDRVSALLAALTLDEKLGLCSGRNFWETRSVPRLGIRSMRLTDGPRGVAFHSTWRRGTAFPSGIALGASWDTDLARRHGEALGRETREAGAHVVLGPAVNLCRTPMCGRTFEYLTEDPHLNARLTVSYVRGVQGEKVAACVKHFAANNQESKRMQVSAQVSQRALRELYLPAFEAAVREGGAQAVMSAYNGVNGTKAGENEALLWDVLREEWGFEGFVVSDWFAARKATSAEACIRAGMSLAMPGRWSRYRMRDLREAVRRGRLHEEDLDRALRGLLRVMFEIGHIDEPARPRRRGISTPDSQVLAREIAAAGITMLRNEAGLLPLDASRLRKVAVLGPTARQRNCLPLWGGSAGVWPPHEITPADGIREALGRSAEIVDDPAGADAAIVCVGLSHRPGGDSEGVDRKHFDLPSAQVALIRKTAATNPNTIVILVAGGPVSMDWAEDVSSVLVAWYPGMEGGRAIADVLTGAVNPSGRLPVTFPRRLPDSPAHRSGRTFPGDGREVLYQEGVFVGYRHFDREDIAPSFPFGHGLSYSDFEYSDLQVEHARWEGEGGLGVSFSVRNRGDRDGAEVVQLYVGDPESSVPRPPRELRAFEKRFLRAGESARIRFELQVRDLAWFCESPLGWRAEPGGFEIEIGSSSRDIRLRGRFELVKDWFLAVGPTV